MKNLPYCEAPCPQCPFRKDIPSGWLGEKRMTEILQSDSFVCHKTTNGKMSDRKQCAGHMIIKGLNNGFVRLAAGMKIPLALKGHELIFDSEHELVNHHK